MNGRRHIGRQLGMNEFTSTLSHPKIFPEQHLRRGGAEANDHLGMQSGNLSIKPRPARRDLRGARFLVYASLAALLPIKMLHDIGNVDFFPVDPRFNERLIQHASCGTDKRFPRLSS